MTDIKTPLAIIELAGYPNFKSLYQRYGYQVVIESSLRKALALLKKQTVDVIVAEFNYQHTFRDRLSNLESIIAVAQTQAAIDVIVLYEPQYENHFEKLRRQFQFSVEIAFPVTPAKMQAALEKLQA